MKHALPDPVADAAMQPLRLAWDGVQLHVHPRVTPEEIDGIIARLKRLQDVLASSQSRGGLILPT